MACASRARWTSSVAVEEGRSSAAEAADNAAYAARMHAGEISPSGNLLVSTLRRDSSSSMRFLLKMSSTNWATLSGSGSAGAARAVSAAGAATAGADARSASTISPFSRHLETSTPRSAQRPLSALTPRPSRAGSGASVSAGRTASAASPSASSSASAWRTIS